MALKSLGGFLISDPVVLTTSMPYGVVSVPGVKVGDLIVSVPVTDLPSDDSYIGNYVASFAGIVTTDDEVYMSSGVDPNYAPELTFIVLRAGC